MLAPCVCNACILGQLTSKHQVMPDEVVMAYRAYTPKQLEGARNKIKEVIAEHQPGVFIRVLPSRVTHTIARPGLAIHGNVRDANGNIMYSFLGDYSLKTITDAPVQLQDVGQDQFEMKVTKFLKGYTLQHYCQMQDLTMEQILDEDHRLEREAMLPFMGSTKYAFWGLSAETMLVILELAKTYEWKAAHDDEETRAYLAMTATTKAEKLAYLQEIAQRFS